MRLFQSRAASARPLTSLRFAALVLVGAGLSACQTSAQTSAQPSEHGAETNTEASSQPSAERSSQPSSQPSGAVQQATDLAAPLPGWSAERSHAAQERLLASDTGRLMFSAIAAHGGLNHWYSRGPISFRFRYAPLGDRPAIDTVQRIDTWRAHAVHQLSDNPEVSFGWDGAQAWVSDPAVELPTNPRFWSLTPYYFMAVPFVLADPGVNLEEAGEERFEGRVYDLIRATFGEGVGDAPEDYYIVYIDRETHRVGGVRYVVSYPGFYPDGGHGAEKFMAYDGSQTIDGVTFPESFRTFSLNEDGTLNEVVTNTTLSAVRFEPDATRASFAVPEGATLKPGY